MIHSLRLAAFAAVTALALVVPATAALAEEGIAARSGTLRAGPGTDFPPVDSVPRGADLEIYGCTEDYRWCDVSTEDNRGWFPGSRIAYDDDGRRVVITEVGPSLGIAVLGFGLNEYWGAHYRNRSFYHNESRYRRFDHYNGPGRPGPGPGNVGPRPGNVGPRPPMTPPPGHNAPRPDRPRPPVQQRNFAPGNVSPQDPRPRIERQQMQNGPQGQRPQVQVQRPQVQAPRPQMQQRPQAPRPQVQAPRPPAPNVQQAPRPPQQNCGRNCNP